LKNLKKLFLLLILFPSFSYSQITTEKQVLLLKTFDFVNGQQNTLNKIKLNFPQQSIEATIAELEFHKNYSKAISSITIKVQKIFGESFNDYVKKLENNSDEYFNSKEMSEENAVLFIEKVKSRAKGSIKSPFIETLLEYQYLDNPVDEFLANHYKLYSVKRYSNSGKTELNVKIPKSWKEIDGMFPFVLKKFRSENGTGNAIITIFVDKISSKTNSNLNINNLFTENELLKMAPKGSKIVAAYSKKIDGKLTGVIEYEDINAKIGSNQKRVVTQYILLYQKNLLRIDCATYGTTTDELLDITIERLEPLYLSILKSIIFNDLNKSSNILTYKIQN